MSPPPVPDGWALEVVRGVEVGRRFALPIGELVLGNAAGGSGALDLSGQEGTSPRRMAARQVCIRVGSGGPVLRDLESPGGTFINRRRVLPGKEEPIASGDVIQLGGVQLKVVGGAPVPSTARSNKIPPPPPASKPDSTATRPVSPKPVSPKAAEPIAFTMAGGPTCRSWDDFLAVSAQRWGPLREELVSGRLAGYLASIGRLDLAPRADAPGTPDERLDAWLGTLPTTRPSRPELDVHPKEIVVKAAGGGRVRRSFRVANVGHRLLKSRARIDPPGATWIVLPDAFGRNFDTVEETEVPFDINVPEPAPVRGEAGIVVEGNGGTSRIVVRLERASARPEIPEGIDDDAVAVESIAPGWIRESLAGWLGRRSVGTRALGGAIGGLIVRLGIGLAGGFSVPATLPGPSAFAAVAGALAGAVWIARGGEARDVPSGAFAGAFGGVIAASVTVAACQAIEPIGGGAAMAVVLWGIIGAMAGWLSILVVPAGSATAGVAP